MNAAVIVETRKINFIRTIIKNHFVHLDKNWELFVFHGKNNGYLFLDLKANLIKLKNDIGIGFPKGHDQGYNNLLTSKSFWEEIPHEKILIFQHDSGLLRSGIEHFLDWDYIGSPIPHTTVQNGGLSIRTRSVMLDIVKNVRFKAIDEATEDTYFCKNIAKFGKLAPPHVADLFSCETIYKLGTIGYHAIDKFLTKEQCKLIRSYYMKINKEEDFMYKNPDIIKAIKNNGVSEDYNESFNEERYLFENLDVARAIEKGFIKSGFEHYVKYGYFENRRALTYSPEEIHLFFKSEFKYAFNEEEYLNNNSDVNEAVKNGYFESGYEHYRRFGYFENRI
jgi:hypothetical protein